MLVVAWVAAVPTRTLVLPNEATVIHNNYYWRMQSLGDLVAGLQINPNLEESLKQLRVMCTNSEQQVQA